MSAREADANYQAMVHYSHHLWSLHAIVRNGQRCVWAMSQSATPPTPEAIADGKAAVREVRMVRRSSGPGWKAEGSPDEVESVLLAGVTSEEKAA